MDKLIVFLFSLLLLVGCWPGKDRSAKCMEEPRDPDCICTAIYDPVCGCNGKTYGNACEARCSNIDTYTTGPCAE